MKRPLLSLLFSTAVVFASPALACMNDYVPNVAAIERSKSILEQLQKHTEKEPWDVRRDRLRKELAASGDYKVKNDLAVALAHTGEAAESVTLLEQIEAEKPSLYVTAANLGTAYELAGNDEKALEWIRKGIERNANAHEGTEWLHVRILEAKLALKSDARWLNFNSVVGARDIDGHVEIAASGSRGEALSINQVKRALIYQLHERLQFVQPPDAIIGDLLLDLGDLVAQEPPGLGAARDVFGLASTYLEKLNGVESLQHYAGLKWSLATLRQRKGHQKDRTMFLVSLAFVGLIASISIIGLKRLIVRKLASKRALPHDQSAPAPS